MVDDAKLAEARANDGLAEMARTRAYADEHTDGRVCDCLDDQERAYRDMLALLARVRELEQALERIADPRAEVKRLWEAVENPSLPGAALPYEIARAALGVSSAASGEERNG